MEELLHVYNLIVEMEDVGCSVTMKGSDVLNDPVVRSQVGRIMTHAGKPPLSQRTPRSAKSILDDLNSFHSYMKHKLESMSISMPDAKALSSWSKDCNLVINSVGVFVTGRGGVFTEDKVKALKRNGTGLVKTGKAFAKKFRGFRICDEVDEIVQDLESSLAYLDSNHPRSMEYELSHLPEPFNLTTTNPFKDIKDPKPDPSTGKLSLSQRKKAKLSKK